jgi:hypothetical protein
MCTEFWCENIVENGNLKDRDEDVRNNVKMNLWETSFGGV